MSAENGYGPGEKVGYGKPPRAHRFKPGVSGNPKGRPRKDPRPSWEALGVDDLLISTLSRELIGTEKGKKSTYTCLDAVMRKLVAAALGNNVHAQRVLIKLASDNARRSEQDLARLFSSALDAQIHLDGHLRAWLARGYEEKALPIHPRDIEIDWEAAQVRLFVAFTRQQREARSTIIIYRDEAIAAIQHSLVVAAEDGDDPVLELVRNVAGAEVDYLNQRLPSRFRREPPGTSINNVSKAVLAMNEAAIEQSRRWNRRVGPILKRTLLAGHPSSRGLDV